MAKNVWIGETSLLVNNAGDGGGGRIPLVSDILAVNSGKSFESWNTGYNISFKKNINMKMNEYMKQKKEKKKEVIIR